MGSLTPIDTAILDYLLHNEGVTQAQLIKDLLPLSGESYLHQRIRTLEARGMIRKERRDGSNTRYLSLTREGRPVKSQG